MRTRILLITLLIVGVLPACQSEENDRVFDSPDEYVRYGNQFLRKQNPNFEAAINQYRYALDLDSHHYDALIGLGDASAYRAKLLANALKSEETEENNQQSELQKQQNPASEGVVQQTSKDMSVEERISALIKQAALAYARARMVRPKAALPLFKYGRMIYQFRQRSPESIDKSIQLLTKARERVPENKKPLLRAKIQYFLGAAKRYRELLKPEEQRNFHETKTHFNRYLDIFDRRGRKAPRRAEIERFLMEREEQGGTTDESGSNS